MRIGIVCYPTYGGSGVVATELGLEMASLGHDVHFISYSQPVRLDLTAPNVYYHEVIVSDYPLFDYSPYELVLTSKLVDVVKNENLDILHVHYAIPHASAAYMAKKILQSEGIELPIVCTLHGTDITLVGKDASFEPVITFAINKSDAVTAVSSSLKEDTLKYFKVNRTIDVIPNFINLSRYENIEPGEIKARFAPNGEPIIMHMSNFRKVKRVPDVLSVFCEVRKHISAKLVLIGDGPERYNIEHMCRQLGVCHDIHFIGKTNDVENVLANGDLFILPSETESFGLAALEAMAAGMPVISSNTGGLPEVNENGVSGFLCDVGAIDQMTDAAVEILKSKDSIEKFKKGAKEQAKKFDLHSILPIYVKLYESLLLPLV
ncbi:MAG: N-acetyl-alpha-D-glucosaminyl L-malate synthase BshA [Flavobacteriales bacterium]